MDKIHGFIKGREDTVRGLASYLWEHPEKSGEEFLSAQKIIDILEMNGFSVTRAKSLPTAFSGIYGTGSVHIGLAAEYDALPGLSQKFSAVREAGPSGKGGFGHGCGHNIIASTCMTAALALKDMIDNEGADITVHFLGCAAEETFGGKHNLIKEGFLNGIDFCMSCHPFDVNKVYEGSTIAMITVDFEFEGIASHAGMAPENGRSALDAVELMDVGANFLREHIDTSCRLHYNITDGGLRPNIVPAHAASRYMIRAPKMAQALGVFRKVINIAKGAALMTETEMKYTIDSGHYEFNSNHVLDAILKKYYLEAEIPKLSDADKEIFDAIAAGISDDQRAGSISQFGVGEFDYCGKTYMDHFDDKDWHGSTVFGSSDIGDISFLIPVSRLAGAVWPLGVNCHTWQASAASGSGHAADIALMMGEVIAKAAAEAASDKNILDAAKKEHAEKHKGLKYVPVSNDMEI